MLKGVKRLDKITYKQPLKAGSSEAGWAKLCGPNYVGQITCA